MAAGLVALLVSLGLGGGSAGVALVWLLAVLVGFVLVLTSRQSAEEVQLDYTHRVSVRIPDLFSLHSFHVHLCQIAEDLGYVVTDRTSPGRGGGPARFDESVYLTEGGFKARKRPIRPSISPLPDDSPYADLASLTTGSMVVATVGASLLATGPRAVGLLLALLGGGLFVYDYVRRTRQWAELYCVEEGTVYTPTASVHDGEPPGEGVVHHEPAVSAVESSTEMVVTLGAKNSVYFEDARLAEDFEALVGQLDDVASENSYTVVDEETRERVAPAQTENGR